MIRKTQVEHNEHLNKGTSSVIGSLLLISIIIITTVFFWYIIIPFETQYEPTVVVEVDEDVTGAVEITLVQSTEHETVTLNSNVTEEDKELNSIGDTVRFNSGQEIEIIAEKDDQQSYYDTVIAEDYNTYVVDNVNDPQSDKEFNSIEEAVETASDGDTIHIRETNEAYEPRDVRLEDNITITSEGTPTMQGDGRDDGSAFRITGENAYVHGIHIDNYGDGVRLIGADTSGLVSDVTITNVTTGIESTSSNSDLVVEDTYIETIEESNTMTTGINMQSNNADWFVSNTSIDADNGIDATSTRGDWRVVNTKIRNGSSGIDASQSHGDWTVAQTFIYNQSTSFDADNTGGDWSIRQSHLERADEYNINADNANGDWVANNVTLVDADINLQGDSGQPEQNAQYNYWDYQGDGVANTPPEEVNQHPGRGQGNNHDDESGDYDGRIDVSNERAEKPFNGR